jgi:surface polysaccharide O-acyltransferase-like enzyme
MSVDKNSSRSINVDLIRVVAMLMVIVMHTILNFTLRIDFFGTKLWFLFEPIVAISKTCVLLFFMLSGYLVINKNRSIQQNWQKTRRRLVIPLVFFSTCTIGYFFYQFIKSGQTDLLLFLQNQLVRVTNFPSSPLWFLGVLVIFYLLNPLWQTIFNPSNQPTTARYLTVLALVFSVSAQIIQFPSLKAGSFFTSFTGWLGYIFFYFYGGLVRNNWIQFKRKKLNYGLVVLGLLGTVLGDWLTIFAQQHNFSFTWTGYTNYLSLPVIMMAVGIFNLLIEAKLEKLKTLMPHATNILTWLAGLSFGIYLIHTFVISFFTDIIGFDFNNFKINVYLYNLLNFSLVLGISLIITWIIKKIPRLRIVIGG